MASRLRQILAAASPAMAAIIRRRIVGLKTLQKISGVQIRKNPDAAVYDSATKRVFIMNVDSKDATVINAASGAVAGTMALGGQAQSPIADGKGNVFVNMADKGQIVEVDAHNLTVAHTCRLRQARDPQDCRWTRIIGVFLRFVTI